MGVAVRAEGQGPRQAQASGKVPLVNSTFKNGNGTLSELYSPDRSEGGTRGACGFLCSPFLPER